MAKKPAKNNPTKTKKIMVVDDDDGILDAFQLLLEAANYDVETSPDGEALYKLNQRNYPDLIILDVLLSGRDGREICKHLKSDPETKEIPVIMVSAHPNVDESVKQSGADDYLPKPFDMDDLLQKIENLTENNKNKH